MPKELVIRLSRLKEKVDSENLANSGLKIKKGKLEKLPQSSKSREFRGFSRDEILSSEIKLNTSGNEEAFLGFSSTEIGTSGGICDERLAKSGENGFLRFLEEDQSDSLPIKSNVLKTDNRTITEIYKTIDRRILNNYINNNKPIVFSKYWPHDENMPFKSNERKRSKCDTSVLLHRESVIFLQIKKLKQELTQIRRQKRAKWERTKLQKSHFVQIKKEMTVPQFVPPKSPHRLLEEDLYHDPWALLVATIFLNKTASIKARPYVFWFLEENPDPLTVVGKSVEDLKMYFKPLGFHSHRALQVWRMSHNFLYKQWTKVSDLHGIGKYGEDAFKMFCLGDFSVKPEDRFLRIYKHWFKMVGKKRKMREMNR